MIVIDGKEIKNIRIKPKWMEIFPLTNENTIQAIYPYIYIPKKHFDKFTDPNSDIVLKSSIIHELEHIKREKSQGILVFIIKYIFSAKFRVNEELEADFASMKYLKKNRISFDINKRAQMLSGWNYLWPEKKVIIIKKLESLWEQA